MVSIDSLYDRIKKFTLHFLGGRSYGELMSGYLTGELQIVVFFMILASLFRIFSIPLGVILLLAVAGAVIYFGPVIMRVEEENENDLNRVIFWIVIYFAVIVAVTLWGR